MVFVVLEIEEVFEWVEHAVEIVVEVEMYIVLATTGVANIVESKTSCNQQLIAISNEVIILFWQFLL